MISYSKYSGAGNTFLFFDNRQKKFPFPKISSLCKAECVDGVILLEDPLRMRIFNKDGSEAEMCGNGLRCFVRYLDELGLKQPSYTIETGAGKLEAKLVGSEVEVKMSDPHSFEWNVSLPMLPPLSFLNTGVPHAVCFVDNVKQLDIVDLGSKIRYHSHFSPKGTNATFVSVEGGELVIRTYERGVEGETLACGTGAVAAAIAAAKKFSLPSPIIVWPASKDKLTISFQREGDRFFDVKMLGPAKKLSQGSYLI